MKLYQQIGCAGIAITITQMSFATSDSQIDTVKEMYQLGEKLRKGNEVVRMYADEGLGRAFEVEDKVLSDGMMCIGYDFMWQGNSGVTNQSLTFTKIGNNQVKVNLAKTKLYASSWVIYKLNCKGNVCKISDVIDHEGSLKKNIYKECQ